MNQETTRKNAFWWGLAGLIVILLALPSAGFCQQHDTPQGWTTSVLVDVGVSATGTNWSLSHPLHEGSQVLWETIDGSGNRPKVVRAGVEFRKRHVAIQGALGMMLSSRLELTSAQPNLTGLPYEIGRTWSFSTYQLEGAALYFPIVRDGGKVVPYLSAGIGYLGTSGDLSINGGFFSFGGGVRLPVTRRVDIDAGLRFLHSKYTDFPLLEPMMTPTLTLTPLAATIGMRFRL